MIPNSKDYSNLHSIDDAARRKSIAKFHKTRDLPCFRRSYIEGTIVMDTLKFNPIMPETDDKILCVRIEKPISAEGYNYNFLPRFKDMLDRNGEARLLVYYKDFKGWEEGAAASDMEMTSIYGRKIRRFALVNPPQSEVFQKRIKTSLFAPEALRLFDERDLDKALDWVRA